MLIIRGELSNYRIRYPQLKAHAKLVSISSWPLIAHHRVSRKVTQPHRKTNWQIIADEKYHRVESSSFVLVEECQCVLIKFQPCQFLSFGDCNLFAVSIWETFRHWSRMLISFYGTTQPRRNETESRVNFSRLPLTSKKKTELPKRDVGNCSKPVYGGPTMDRETCFCLRSKADVLSPGIVARMI